MNRNEEITTITLPPTRVAVFSTATLVARLSYTDRLAERALLSIDAGKYLVKNEEGAQRFKTLAVLAGSIALTTGGHVIKMVAGGTAVLSAGDFSMQAEDPAVVALADAKTAPGRMSSPGSHIMSSVVIVFPPKPKLPPPPQIAYALVGAMRKPPSVPITGRSPIAGVRRAPSARQSARRTG